MAEVLTVERDGASEPVARPGTRNPPRWSPSASQIIALPAAFLGVTAVLRYFFGRATIDLVVFDQGIWAASRTGVPWVSVIGENLLGDHFGPAILLFSLPYRIVATPIWLLVGQAVAAWLGVRLIARKLVPAIGEVKAGLVGAALLLSPPIAYAVLFDVHSVTFAVPLALAAVFALEERRMAAAFLLGLLAAMFRVEIGLAVLVVFAVWPGSRRGRLLPGLGLFAYIATASVLEQGLGHDHYWAIHYGHLGAGPLAALRDPIALAGHLLSGDGLVKALPWLATGAFLALRRPRLVLPAAVLSLPILLSNWPGTKGIVFHYGYAPTLFLALAWLPVVVEQPARARHVVSGCLLLALLLGPVFPALAEGSSVVPFAGTFWPPRTEARCIVAGIPGDAAVSASQPLGLLAHRSELYLWPYPFQGPDPKMLPSDFLARGDASLAEGVDYLVIMRGDAPLVPAGFSLEGQSERYLRYRRDASTSPSEFRSCG
jgi:uncharacterized membrane protein